MRRGSVMVSRSVRRGGSYRTVFRAEGGGQWCCQGNSTAQACLSTIYGVLYKPKRQGNIFVGRIDVKGIQRKPHLQHLRGRVVAFILNGDRRLSSLELRRLEIESLARWRKRVNTTTNRLKKLDAELAQLSVYSPPLMDLGEDD